MAGAGRRNALGDRGSGDGKLRYEDLYCPILGEKM